MYYKYIYVIKVTYLDWNRELKVHFDGQAFVMQVTGGISRYCTSLAVGLNADPEVDARIIAPLHCNRHLSEEPMAPVVGIKVPFNLRVRRVCRFALRIFSPVLSRCSPPDLVHETYFSHEPVLTYAPRRVTMVHDMIHELYFPGSRVTQYKRDTLARCDHVICNSHHTKKDLCEIFNFPSERASVTHLAYQDFSTAPTITRLSEFNAPPYFLYVGHRAGYKNFDAFLCAFAMTPHLLENFRIVSFGGGPFTDDELRRARQLGLSPQQVVHVAGSDDLLGLAYSNAVAFVYPSLYEGFGIPPLEAMSAGCPVISSNSSSLPEVVGDAALLVDPNDVESLAVAMMEMAQSPDLRRRLVDRGHQQRQLFSWEKCVRDTRDIYESIL